MFAIISRIFYLHLWNIILDINLCFFYSPPASSIYAKSRLRAHLQNREEGAGPKVEIIFI